jgi:hypothetical protein
MKGINYEQFFSAQTSTQHICSSVEPVTKNDNCPNPSTFSILAEHSKNDTTWKLDFKVKI